MVKEYSFHPLADEYDLLSDRELENMAEGMRQHGFNPLHPVVLYQGKILDGRNRQIAAAMAGVEPTYYELAENGVDPEFFVEQENDIRRHDDVPTRTRHRTLRAGRIQERRRKGESLRMIAEGEGVSLAQVQRDLAGDPAVPGGDTVIPEGGVVVGKDNKKRSARGKGTKGPRKKKAPEPSANGAQATVFPPDTPATDDYGIPVGEDVAAAFQAVPLFVELLTTLKSCRKLYATLAEHAGGVCLLQGSVSINARDKWKNRGLEQAILSIEDCCPSMAVCPFEYGDTPHPEDCGLCGGRHWTPPFSKNSVPKELVAAAREAHGV